MEEHGLMNICDIGDALYSIRCAAKVHLHQRGPAADTWCSQGITWAARYYTWLLVKLALKGFSFLFFFLAKAFTHLACLQESAAHHMRNKAKGSTCLLDPIVIGHHSERLLRQYL